MAFICLKNWQKIGNKLYLIFTLSGSRVVSNRTKIGNPPYQVQVWKIRDWIWKPAKKIQLPSEYRTSELQIFDLYDTFLSRFQMV